MTSLVTARNVSKHYGKLRAVDDISFDIEKGCFCAGAACLLPTVRRSSF